MFDCASLTLPTPLDDTTEAEFVESESALDELAEHLARHREFAVDLEHHSYRSFQGFTCLMQISTRERDFVVDTLALRGRLRAALAPHFADPTKLKVMHGADNDVQWLQRDFGIYIVGRAWRDVARHVMRHTLDPSFIELKSHLMTWRASS